MKEEILAPALADWENVKKKLVEKKLEKEREEEEEKAREARKAAGIESPPDVLLKQRKLQQLQQQSWRRSFF